MQMDTAWRALGSTPLDGGEPYGVDPTDDVLFEGIEAEVDKLQTDPAAVDWGTVIENGVELLAHRTKDWRVACRMATALYQVHGFDGLAVGSTILRDLIDESRWERITPPIRRAKMRGGFLQWFAERLNGALAKMEAPPDAEDADALACAAECIGEVTARVSSVLSTPLGQVAAADLAGQLNMLNNRLDQLYLEAKRSAQEHARVEPEPQGQDAGAATGHSASVDSLATAEEAHRPDGAARGDTPDVQGGAPVPDEPVPATGERPSAEASPATAAGTTAPRPAPAAAPAVPKIQAGGDPTKTLRELKNVMLAVSASLRQSNPSDARAYTLLRTAIWIDIERLPPNQDGVTPIPEPSMERRKQFEQLQQQADWINLIEEVEKTLAAGSIFWLDGHRLVAIALDELGHAFRDARRSVVAALSALLQRFPGLEKLKFQQGSGFASELTLAWIAAEVAPTAGAGDDQGGAAEDAPWHKAASDAKGLAMKGKARDGLALFRDGIRTAGSARERFCWVLAQARACADAGYTEIAAQQARHLAQLADHYQLDEWEPALSVELAALFVSLHGASVADADAGAGAAGEPALAAIYQRMLERLCRFDAVAATDAALG